MSIYFDHPSGDDLFWIGSGALVGYGVDLAQRITANQVDIRNISLTREISLIASSCIGGVAYNYSQHVHGIGSFVIYNMFLCRYSTGVLPRDVGMALALSAGSLSPDIHLATAVGWSLLIRSLLKSLFPGEVVQLHFEDTVKAPRNILIQLLPKMAGGQFPEISYYHSDGLDEEGLSRDLATRLLLAVFDPQQPLLPMKPKAHHERYIPIVDAGSDIPVAKQFKCYRAIGAIFAAALQEVKDITTGPHLQPAVFEMLHTLSGNLLQKIPPNVSRLEDIPPVVLVKLVRAYVKAEMPSMPREWLTKILCNRFDEEFIAMTGYESREHFYKTIGFEPIALAVLAIAQGLRDNMVEEWDALKGNTANDLRRSIEGTISVDQVKNAIKCKSALDVNVEQTVGFLARWIDEATPDQLENFVWAISGSRGLKPEQKLKVRLVSEDKDLPTFQTCSMSMRLPNDYKDYETFKSKLERAIAESLSVAPQFV